MKSENILRLVEPELLIPTVEVLEEPLLRHAFKNILRYDSLYPPIVVTPVYSMTSHLGRRNFFIILDGNHRACKCALYDSPLKAIMVTKDSDIDIILELELRSILPRFPHRKFLLGEQTLKTLVKEAIEAASKINCTIMEMAQKIKSYRKIQEDIQRRYGLIVRTCLIAQVKELNGLNPRETSNRRSPSKRSNSCPENIRLVIEESMRRLGMIE